MNEQRWRLIQLIALVVGNIVAVTLAYGKMDARTTAVEYRVTVAENRIDEEVKGYRILLSSYGERMRDMDVKLDRLLRR